MLAPIEQMPSDSRVWVYQSPRLITSDEQQRLMSGLFSFIDSWTAHQAGLRAAGAILHDRFVVIAVDENHNHASGCSIDKMVHFMKIGRAHV